MFVAPRKRVCEPNVDVDSSPFYLESHASCHSCHEASLAVGNGSLANHTRLQFGNPALIPGSGIEVSVFDNHVLLSKVNKSKLEAPGSVFDVPGTFEGPLQAINIALHVLGWNLGGLVGIVNEFLSCITA